MLKSIFTLGPASRDLETLAALHEAAHAFRLNASHLSPDALGDWLERLDRLFDQSGRPVPVYVDLQGAKMRVGTLPARDRLPDRVRFVLATAAEAPDAIPVPHEAFFEAVQVGDVLTLHDALVTARVTRTSSGEVLADVVSNGPLSSRQGLNRPVHPLPCPRLSPSDLAAVETAVRFPFTCLAFSFVLDGAEAALLRPLAGDRPLVAKIERPEAFPHLEAIASTFDALWLCRGDLGAQAGLAALGPLQQAFTDRLARCGKPLFLAGQVLEHMTHFPHPTRTEVVHLHDAERAGFAGIVLSDETAIGRYPREVAAFLAALSAPAPPPAPSEATSTR